MDEGIEGTRLEILLVEDGLMDARVTIEALRGGNVQHRLTLVRDGEEALQFLRKDGRFAKAPTPDLVLLDLMLPKKNGLDVLVELRGEPDLQDLPVVVLTASEEEDDRSRCETLQVDSYIPKPVNLEKFLGVIKELKRCWREDVILPTT